MAKLSYTQFLWKSANAHNVHSPFVFSITGKAFAARNIHFPPFNKEKKSIINQKAFNLLCRIVFNLKREKLFVTGEDAAAATEIIRSAGEHLNLKLWFFSPLAPIPGKIDMAYIAPGEDEELYPLIEQLLPNIGENSLCAIGNIHSSPEREKAWEAIKKDPRISVTIDTYHLGLVYFRHGQAKEHFTIRTTTSKLLDTALGAKKLWGLLN